jgi:hypothetical protein
MKDIIINEYVIVDNEPLQTKKDKPKTSWYDYFRRSWNDSNIIFMLLIVYLYLLYKREPNSHSRF